MRLLYLFLGFVLILGCQGRFLLTESEEEGLQVVSVEPADGAVIDSLNEIGVTFSSSINDTTISSSSFLVVSASQVELEELDLDDLLDAIEDEDIVSLQGNYSYSEDQKKVSWVPLEALNTQTTYYVIVTSKIQNLYYYPLNQTPGEDTTYFSSQFILKGEGVSSSISDKQVLEPSSVMIHEIYYDDDQSDTDGNLFVEIYGTPGGDIGGYTLRLINGENGSKTDEVVIPQGTQIPNDGFFVIADERTGSAGVSQVAEADLIDNFDPQNGPDSIQLLNASGQVMDVIGYGEDLGESDSEGNPLYEETPTLLAEAGFSLSRLNQIDTDHNKNDFVVNEIPSPGTGEVSGGEVQNQPDELEITTKNEVHFTEVVTDPQQDWNDTLGGNGIAFDVTFGSGTVGTTDEWIEIKNGREESVDLTGWRIEMKDGSDETELLSTGDSVYLFSDGGSFSLFQPDEFLVIGDPDGDLKNTITLELFNDEEELVDQLVIDDANASGIEDESYQLSEDGLWEMGEATIGF